mmetsp:Transcript_15124/g.45561  ORF Transcript_15124/g.45561 Transcript_15124/m.45561 type:complete len:249 (-) Transcript_15124:1949-2695(-)
MTRTRGGQETLNFDKKHTETSGLHLHTTSHQLPNILHVPSSTLPGCLWPIPTLLCFVSVSPFASARTCWHAHRRSTTNANASISPPDPSSKNTTAKPREAGLRGPKSGRPPYRRPACSSLVSSKSRFSMRRFSARIWRLRTLPVFPREAFERPLFAREFAPAAPNRVGLTRPLVGALRCVTTRWGPQISLIMVSYGTLPSPRWNHWASRVTSSSRTDVMCMSRMAARISRPESTPEPRVSLRRSVPWK